jgi:hypothetical protein
MRLSKFLYLIVFLFLFGCSVIPQPKDNATVPTSKSTAGLPPTWTPTASSVPSQTPVRAPTQTFTPLPSATSLPPTLTIRPTSNIPTPTFTPTITPTITSGCAVSALEEGIILQQSPFYDPYGLLPTMAPTATYEAVRTYPTYFELTLENESVGWVDYRLITLDIEGPGCDRLPTDTRELAEFPDLCFFTPDGKEVTTYSDSTLSRPLDTISGTGNFVTLLQLEEVYCTVISHAGPSFCVKAADVQLLGNCENVTRSGITTVEDWLWSQPNGEVGKETISFGKDMRIYFQDDPVQGPKPPSTSEEGAWYYVRIGSQKDGAYGWIWSSFFAFR